MYYHDIEVRQWNLFSTDIFFRWVVIEQTKTNKDSDTIVFFFADFVKYFRSAFLQKPSEWLFLKFFCELMCK